MTYSDKQAPAAYRLQREVPASYRIPNDLEQSTYALRTGFRFGDGKPVRASAFANAFNRALQPFVNAAGRIARRRGAAGQTAAPDRHLSGGRR